MKFRSRLLILLLLTALVPLSLSFLWQRSSVIQFGNKLAGDTRDLLNSSAVNLLHALIEDYGHILNRDRSIALLTLQAQANAVESRLASNSYESAADIYFSDDFLHPELQPQDITPSYKHQRPTANGSFEPIPVSYAQQVVFLAKGTLLNDVRTQLLQLSSMPQVYRNLHDIQPDLFLWQYTALESGIHTSYPGKGGYPDDYDPRHRPWYRQAVETKKPIQQLIIDLSTRTLILTLAMPVHDATGHIAGVTAIDIDYRQFFNNWDIPAEWADVAESMVLIYHDQEPDPEKRLEILLRSQHQNHIADWKMPVEHKFLSLTDDLLADVKDDILNGRSAVRKITYRGTEALFAYGGRTQDQPFPLVMVPFERILAKADDAESYINSQMKNGLRTSALLALGVALAAIVVALIRARKVTRPLTQLADQARKLAAGDFAAKVDIRSRDEFADLGRIFNRLGTNLRERQQLKQSLALAKEIQQQLLPLKTPECPGFELAGLSHYCDETGGDYYDFIPLDQTGEGRLGLALGDVSGHGIGAALVMAMARGALHSLVDHYGQKLNTLFTDLNQHLCRSTADNFFMTLFYGVHPHNRQLYWISAGQAPIFYWHQGQLNELCSSGIPLGIIDSASYEGAEKLHLNSGDLLIIGTDGIWETRNLQGEMFGTERLARLISSNSQSSAEQLSALIVSELNQFRGAASQTDDMTLMILKAR